MPLGILLRTRYPTGGTAATGPGMVLSPLPQGISDLLESYTVALSFALAFAA
jgi:hypothetical protein